MNGAGGWKRDPASGQWTAAAPQSGSPSTPAPPDYTPQRPPTWSPPRSSASQYPSEANSWSAPFSGRPSQFGRDAAGPDRPRSGRGPWIALGIGATVVVILGIVASAQPSTMSINGTVTVGGMSGYVYAGQACKETSSGSRTITVYDDEGTIVGTTTVTGAGVATIDDSSRYGYADACRFSYTVPDVPADSDFFRITSLNSTTGSVTFSKEEAAQSADLVIPSF